MSIARIYEAFRETETDPARRLGWDSHASQQAHHAALFGLLDKRLPIAEILVRDVGCGDGAAVPWCRSRSVAGYEGVDVDRAALDAAVARWPGVTFRRSASGLVDVSFAVGTLAYHGPVRAVALLERMWATSRVGIAFTLWHDVPQTEEAGPLAQATQAAVSSWASSRHVWTRVRPEARTSYWVVRRSLTSRLAPASPPSFV